MFPDYYKTSAETVLNLKRLFLTSEIGSISVRPKQHVNSYAEPFGAFIAGHGDVRKKENNFVIPLALVTTRQLRMSRSLCLLPGMASFGKVN
jgi:hypothetical protein